MYDLIEKTFYFIEKIKNINYFSLIIIIFHYILDMYFRVFHGYFYEILLAAYIPIFGLYFTAYKIKTDMQKNDKIPIFILISYFTLIIILCISILIYVSVFNHGFVVFWKTASFTLSGFMCLIGVTLFIIIRGLIMQNNQKKYKVILFLLIPILIYASIEQVISHYLLNLKDIIINDYKYYTGLCIEKDFSDVKHNGGRKFLSYKERLF